MSASTAYKRVFQIDSHRRLSGTHSDFTYPIQLQDFTRSDAKGLSIVLLGANLPKSYYIVRGGKNSFTLAQNGSADATITIPPGNYNALNFRTAVVALLNAAATGGRVYTAEFSTLTGKYTFSVTGGTGASFVMPNSITISDIHEQLGLNPATTTALPFTSTNVVRFETQTSLQIHTNLVSNGSSDVLLAVYASENASFSSIAYNSTDIDARSKPLSMKGFAAARFYITDEDGVTVDFNGLNVSLTVMVYFPLENVIREYIEARSIELYDSPMDRLLAIMKQMTKMMSRSSRPQELAAPAPPPPPPPPPPPVEPPAAGRSQDEKGIPIES